MIYQMYALYDSKAEAFNTPRFYRTRGEAIRSFSDACNDPQGMIFAHPGDYSFFFLGTYDDQNAAFNHLAAPENIGSGVEFKKEA